MVSTLGMLLIVYRIHPYRTRFYILIMRLALEYEVLPPGYMGWSWVLLTKFGGHRIFLSKLTSAWTRVFPAWSLTPPPHCITHLPGVHPIKFGSHRALTLKWPRYFYSRWCPRGVPWNPPEKTTFPPEFCNEICTIYVRAIKNHNSAKKILKFCTVSKWRPNNRFLFRVILILAKYWKTNFPKEIFNEIWLKEGEYEYIYIIEIKFLKKLFRFKMMAKTIFWYCAIMLIYAN